MSNSPEISLITFILLFYFIIMFLKAFSWFYSTYIYYNNRSLCVNYVLIILMWYVRPAKPQISLRSLIRAFASRLKTFTLRYPFFASISAESGKREWSFVT